MAELTDEEKRILEKLLKDRHGPRPPNEKFTTDIDPKKWDAPIGLDDEGNPYPPTPSEAQTNADAEPLTPEEEARILERVAQREREFARQEAEEAEAARKAHESPDSEETKPG